MTKAKFKALLGLLLLAWLAAAPVQAAEDPSSQPYVVIVGVGKHADKQILPRPHADSDARAFYELFTNKDYLGVDAQHIRLLLSAKGAEGDPPSEPATRANILKALNWVSTNARKDDLVIVVFLGQGAPEGERSYFFASDSTYKNRANDALAPVDIEQALDKLKSQRFCAFIDINFKGFNPGKERAPELNPLAFERTFLGKEDEAHPTISRVVYLANNGLRPSLELKDQGLFTKVALDGLKGAADKDGYEADGTVTVGELAKYINHELPEQARQNGKTNAEKGQVPLVLEFQATDFALTTNPAVHAKVQKRLAAFAKFAKAEKLSVELTAEGKDLLSRMPKLEAKQSLRKAYQKVADGTLTWNTFEKERQAILDSTKLSAKEARDFGLALVQASRMVYKDYLKSTKKVELLDWAIRGMYKRLDEKLPPTVEEQLRKVKSQKKVEDVDLLQLAIEARKQLGKREDLANGKDITLGLHMMLGHLDRHTDYIDPETLVRLKTEIEGNFTGIGVQIRRNTTHDALQVVTPIMDSPAYKAKMQAGDLITHIIREVDSDGERLPSPETLPTKGMSTEDAVKKILGKEGTPVKLLVKREGQEKPLEFNLIRGQVEMETVLGHKRSKEDQWDYVIDPENKICYVRLTQFSYNTRRDLQRVMDHLTKKVGIKGFILDLRFNPGGLLDSAVRISDIFIDDGVIVTIKPRNGPETSYIGKHDGSYLTFPMVCLVNGESASASEIVAGCLQDHTRAIIMGSRTYGKGSVQTIHSFGVTGGKLKLTTATYWRPSGKNIHKGLTSGKESEEWGVTPNQGYVLKLPTPELYALKEHQRESEIIRPPGNRQQKEEAKEPFRDRQLEMALDYLRGQIRTNQKTTKVSQGG
jgi:C-terminal peptidase prc